MTRARARSAVAVAVAVIAVVAFSALSAGAGTPSGNMVTVNKVVTGTVPAGTTFTVELTCNGSFKGGPDFTVITFDEHGTPTSGNNVVSGIPASTTTNCTANETITGGATSVSYACTTAGDRATCPDGATAPHVRFVDVDGSSGVITVTNTFPVPTPPTTPTTPAAEVVVEPAFTG